MIKNILNISALSVICAVCAATGAHAASTVRSLGGAGTYNSASTAAAAKTSGSAITAARAGSLRVSPSSTTAKSTGSVAAAANTSGATQARLSLGKYLGAVTSTSGGIKNQNAASGSSNTVIKPGLSGSDINVTEIENRISVLENNVGDLNVGKIDDRVADLEKQIEDLDVTEIIEIGNQMGDLKDQIDSLGDLTEISTDLADINTNIANLESTVSNKQDALSAPDPYISISSNNEILLDTDALKDALGAATGQNIEMDVDDESIKWRGADGEWKTLIALSALKGEKGEPGSADVNLENYLTKDEMNTELSKAIDAASANGGTIAQKIADAVSGAVSDLDGKYATAAQGAKAETALQAPGEKPTDGEYVLMTSGGVETWVKIY
ncbi:hypothetical protein HDR63_03880 [bacterium]|nr:hypothetical protein [bacterium]